jgi:hypothetical protein
MIVSTSPPPAIPRADAEEDAVIEPLRAVISVGGASIRVGVVIAIRANWLLIIPAIVIIAAIGRSADAEPE